MAREWHVWVGDKQYGPISSAQLKQWATEGRIGPDAWVREKGIEQWVAAGEMPGLFSSVMPASPVPKPVPASEQETSEPGFLDFLGRGTRRMAGLSRSARSLPPRQKKSGQQVQTAAGVGCLAVVLILAVIVAFYSSGSRRPEEELRTEATGASGPVGTERRLTPSIRFPFDVPSLCGMTIDEVRRTLGPPKGDAKPEPSERQLALGVDEWENVFEKAGDSLLVTFNPQTRDVIDFFIDRAAYHDADGSIPASKLGALLRSARLATDAPDYRVEPVTALGSTGFTGVKVTPKRR